MANLDTYGTNRYSDAGRKDRKPCCGKQCDDIFVVLIKSGDAQDEEEDGKGYGEWIQQAHLSNHVAVADGSRCEEKLLNKNASESVESFLNL